MFLNYADVVKVAMCLLGTAAAMLDEVPGLYLGMPVLIKIGQFRGR
jgi:hypothetical protein